MNESAVHVFLSSVPLLLKGTGQTLLIALYSILISTILGVLFGATRTFSSKWLQVFTRIYVEIFRSLPVLVTMFFFFFGLPIFFGTDVSSIFAAVLAISLWGIAEIGEIARGALQSIPIGQMEAGKSLGFNKFQIYNYILIPQAIRVMIPSTMNIYTRIIKTTSISVLIGVTEVMKMGEDVIQRTAQPLIIYATIFVLYFLLCYPLSLWSSKLEKKSIYS
jgi:polar amino acid transport system permease protein